MKRRILCCLLLAVLLLGMLPAAQAAGKAEISLSSDSPDVPGFTDTSDNWAEGYILLAAEKGLIIGDGNGLYRPDDEMTRAELVTILWRMAGSPEPQGQASFKDLKQEWQKKPVAWAEENNIVLGMGEGIFAPQGNVTREQLITILHRMADTPSGMEMFFASVYDGLFEDSGKISNWAKSAIYWGVYEEIYCGETTVDVTRLLAPKANATRAQIAVMIIRYLNDV